ncbi:MAG: hypothetical protein JWR23_1862 [Mucilaginibacter sp.]|nr:hypothetical protein [Mucilaginibacter sp.]
MVQYNIIYMQAGHPYLWNGHSFDKLQSTDRKNLHYSGPITNDDNLLQTLQKCREALQSVFPHDAAAELEVVEVDIVSAKGVK